MSEPAGPVGGSSERASSLRALGAWVLRLAVTIGLGAWLWHLTDAGALRELFARMRPGGWMALLGMAWAVLIVHVARWRLVLRALGERPAALDLAGDVLVGMSYNLVLPTTVGGDIIRALRCGARLEAAHRAWSSSIYERLAGLVATALGALAAVLAAGSVLGAALGGVTLVAALGLLVFWRAEVPMQWFASIAGRVGGAPAAWSERIAADFAGPLSGLGLRLRALGWSLIGVLGLVAYGWISAWALGVEGAGLALAVALPVAQLTSAVPVSINGLGLREGTIVLVLSAYGFDESFALAVALLLLAGLIAEGALGLVWVATGWGTRPRGSVSE